MRPHRPIRRLVLAVASVFAVVALVIYLWAEGRTDGGLYCTSAYPETNGDVACGAYDPAGITLFIALVMCALAGAAELTARARAVVR